MENVRWHLIIWQITRLVNRIFRYSFWWVAAGVTVQLPVPVIHSVARPTLSSLSEAFTGFQQDPSTMRYRQQQQDNTPRQHTYHDNVMHTSQYRTTRYATTIRSLLRKNIILLNLIVGVCSLFIDFNNLLFGKLIAMLHCVFQIEYHPMLCTGKLHLLYAI